MTTMMISADELRGDDLIVTPSRRSARYWTNAFARAQSDAGQRAWVSPQVRADSEWYRSVWREWQVWACGRAEVSAMPSVLSVTQEAALWQRVVRENLPAGVLSHTEQWVAGAMQAWQTGHRFGYPFASLSAEAGGETAMFAKWTQAFFAHLRALNAITQAQLPTALAEQLRGIGNRSEVMLPSLMASRVVTLPVVQAEPAFEHLLRALVGCGLQHAELQLGAPHAPSACAAYASAGEEWRAAARWAGEHAKTARNPGDVIVVIPELQRSRHEIAEVFTEVLLPELNAQPMQNAGKVFEFSLGVRLSDVPLVAGALAWLRLRPNGFAIDDARAALNAPFVPSAQIAWVAKAIDAGLQRLSVRELRRVCGEAHSCHAFVESVRAWPRSALPSVWADHIANALAVLGFPGTALDTEGLQALAAWRETLGSLGEIDSVLGAISADAVLQHVQSRCQSHDFQPEGQGAPIQVVGLYESLGLHCEHLLVCGLDDATLPGATELSPYLPAHWQYAVSAGRATPTAMQRSAEAMWAQWQHTAAQEFCVSFTAVVDDAHRQASPLLRGLPIDPVHLTDPAIEGNTPRKMVQIDDHVGSTWSSENLPGAMRNLQAHAECPFYGYAIAHFDAEPWPSPGTGLTPRERGTLVHTTLQRLWHHLEEVTVWPENEPARQREVVAIAVETALNETLPKEWERDARGWPEALRDAIADSTTATVLDWMKIDTARVGVVSRALEQPVQLTLGGHSMRLRVDRIDRLESGATVVVDYKTGASGSAKSLLDEGYDVSRKPQLPAYALALADAHGGVAPAGVGWATIKPRECKLTGVGIAAAGLPETKVVKAVEPDAWLHVVARWRSALTARVNLLTQGEAAVAPINRAICNQCQRQAVCRIAAQATDEEADAEGGEIANG